MRPHDLERALGPGATPIANDHDRRWRVWMVARSHASVDRAQMYRAMGRSRRSEAVADLYYARSLGTSDPDLLGMLLGRAYAHLIDDNGEAERYHRVARETAAQAAQELAFARGGFAAWYAGTDDEGDEVPL